MMKHITQTVKCLCGFLVAPFIYCSTASEENSICIGAEWTNGSKNEQYENIEKWNRREKIKIYSSPTLKVMSSDIEKIGVYSGVNGPCLVLQLTDHGRKVLNDITKKLRNTSGRIALMIDDKLVFLAGFSYPLYETQSICFQPVPLKIIQKLKGDKDVEWYLPD